MKVLSTLSNRLAARRARTERSDTDEAREPKPAWTWIVNFGVLFAFWHLAPRFWKVNVGDDVTDRASAVPFIETPLGITMLIGVVLFTVFVAVPAAGRAAKNRVPARRTKTSRV